MDSDQYYDSLDEETTISGATVKSNKRITAEPLDRVEIASLVPLYQREIHKRDVKRPKKSKNCCKNIVPSRTDVSLVRRKQTKVAEEEEEKIEAAKSIRTRSKSSFFSNSSLSGVLEAKPKKTYLDLFHKKIGYVQGTPGNDTTRGLKGDDTFRSALSSESGDGTEFSDALSFVSDSSSFYINFLEEEKRKNRDETADTVTDRVSNLSLTESKFNLHSVSEYSIKGNNTKNSAAKKSNASFKITKPNRSVVEVPALGRLGPDPEAIKVKMEKLKRQQSYGQKVSNENRMRMLELQVIKNFNHEMKKSSDINKNAKNIIIT